MGWTRWRRSTRRCRLTFIPLTIQLNILILTVEILLAILAMNRKDRSVSKMEVRATVYITGANASAARAKELNALAKNTFKSSKVYGAAVGFNVKYVYKKDIDKKDLKPGENILNFVNKGGRSEVDGYTAEDSFDGSRMYYTGNTGTITS